MRQGQQRAAYAEFCHFVTQSPFSKKLKQSLNFKSIWRKFLNDFKKLQKFYIDDDQHVVDVLNGNLTIFEEMVPGAEKYFEEKEAL